MNKKWKICEIQRKLKCFLIQKLKILKIIKYNFRINFEFNFSQMIIKIKIYYKHYFKIRENNDNRNKNLYQAILCVIIIIDKGFRKASTFWAYKITSSRQLGFTQLSDTITLNYYCPLNISRFYVLSQGIRCFKVLVLYEIIAQYHIHSVEAFLLG